MNGGWDGTIAALLVWACLALLVLALLEVARDDR